MKTCFISFLFICSHLLYSQQWHWKNPYPVGSKLNGIFFSDSVNAFAVGSDGNVILTTNGGKTWEHIALDPSSELQKICFNSNNFGVIVGGDDGVHNGGLFVSTDGGKNWVDRYPLEPPQTMRYALFDVQMTEGSVAWVSGFEGVLKTTNKGETWYKTKNSGGWITSIYFIDDSAGWSADAGGNIFKTTDAGETWTKISSLGWFTTRRIRFATPSLGWIVGNKLYESVGFIAMTTDGGVTWKFQDSSGTGYRDLCIIDTTCAIAVGNNGLIQYTTNGGDIWYYSGTNSQSEFNDIEKVADKLYAVGGGYGFPTIATNRISALSSLWNVQKTYFTLTTLNTISFINDSLGWLAGEDGVLFKTVNGGLTWDPYNLFSVNFLSSCATIENSIFFGGKGGELVSSLDGGTTWRVLTFGKYKGVTQLQFPTPQKGWFVLSTEFFSGGELYRTTDRGNKWHKVNVDSFSFTSIARIQFHDSLTGWFCEPPPVIVNEGHPQSAQPNAIGRMFKTIDGGTVWEQISTPAIVNQFFFISKDVGWASVYTLFGWDPFPPPMNDTLYKTTDGGTSWIPCSIIPNLNAADELIFVSETDGWLRINSDIYHTQDGGKTFQKSMYAEVYDNQHRLYFPSSKIGWFVGKNGTLMQFSNLPTSVERQPTQDIPSSFVLHQNYPNPFNPTTNIEFQIQKRSHVKLTIYNILGQKIDELLNEVKEPGSYKIVWNSRGLTSGTYFYTMQSNNTVQTKKLLLLK